jgi:hypothetical protein
MFVSRRGVGVNKRLAWPPIFRWATLLAALFLMAANPLAAQLPAAMQGASQAGRDPDSKSDACESDAAGSPYIPVDSWIYPAMLRLYSLGYVDTVYLGTRPWTRSSVSNLLDEVGSRIEDYDADPATDEAEKIYEALTRELRYDSQNQCLAPTDRLRVESVYSGNQVSGHGFSSLSISPSLLRTYSGRKFHLYSDTSKNSLGCRR